MKILVTGSDGMVGSEFIEQSRDYSFIKEVVCSNFDVTDPKSVLETIEKVKPDAIFHLAAMTDVDGCERNSQECYNINIRGTAHVCQGAKKVGAVLIYPSTTYIYDGEKGSPYDERSDSVAPEKIVGVYSKSKWEGEVLSRQLSQHLIVRFGALFGGGKNDKKFVAKIISKVKFGEKEIEAVKDRIIQPSSVKDTVQNLLKLIELEGRGVFNMVGQGCATYVEYMQALLDFMGAHDVKVVPVLASHYKEAAPRAKNITAINGRLNDMGINLMRDWKTSLKEYVNDYFK